MTKDEKRKEQLRKAQKTYRANKKKDEPDLVNFTTRIKREWRQKIKDYIDKLRKGNAE